MSSVKELKSVDLSSYTLIMTGIAVVFSIITAIGITVGIGLMSPASIGVSLYLIPTIIVGAFMCSIYSCFSQGLFYNVLAKKFNTIKLTFNDGNDIVKISPAETATMIGLIAIIETVLLYLVSSFVLPIVLNASVQTLMMGGQQAAAYSLYQLLVLLNEPSTVAVVILGSFIITFVFTLIAVYIYNILGSNGRGVSVNLSSANTYTVLESVDPLKLAIVVAIITGVINLILSVILLVNGGNLTPVVFNVIGGFVGGFIEAGLFAVFYNYLSPVIGKLKIELIDQK